MNWSRLVGVAAAGLVLCGCAHSASTSRAAQSPGASAHAEHRTADAPSGTPRKPTLTVNGNLDARPGQLVDIRLYDVVGAQGHDAVTAQSPAFSGPVPLRWQDGSYGGTPALAMTDKPGWYPLSVAVAGRTVARDRIHVVASRRPSFTLTSGSDVARPGEPVWLTFDDLYPGERGTGFTVRSAALSRPVPLLHSGQSDFYNPREFTARPELKPALADGRYTVELYGPHGRRIAERHLTVRASRPGDRDYFGKAYGPDLYDPRIGYADSPHGRNFEVAAAGQVAVMWHDADPDPGEESRLTATSPAFTHVLHLRPDDSKSADGDDPRCIGTATLRGDLEPGRYPVTVVAHHGRVKKTGYLTVKPR
ncbi:hypothetical protein ACU639_04010 [Streptomyces cynarae]|uniref:hypothetical protein n=1 Tax=Streptomyces cynarae TaxID=2981134 RepID=UPI00406D305F